MTSRNGASEKIQRATAKSGTAGLSKTTTDADCSANTETAWRRLCQDASCVVVFLGQFGPVELFFVTVLVDMPVEPAIVGRDRSPGEPALARVVRHEEPLPHRPSHQNNAAGLLSQFSCRTRASQA